MKIVILIPLGSRTGGPEAQHQLSHQLIISGYDAYVWYVIPSDLEGIKNLHHKGQLNKYTILDIGERVYPIVEYAKYKTNPIINIPLSDDIYFVIPEVYMEFIKYLQFCRHILWWLSVDNAFGYLSNGQVNLNYLRKSNCIHAFQSLYAKGFLSAINLNRIFPLSDYTPAFIANSNNIIKNGISINAGNKVIFDVNEIANKIKQLCSCEVYLLRDMNREEIYDCLEKSRIYIDLAHFPGKDRMPREALLRDCCVLIANSGAGFGDDFSLPKEFKFDVNELKILPEVSANIFNNFEFNLSLCADAISKVKGEELIFKREVTALMCALESSA